jgi:hypothetical protein
MKRKDKVLRPGGIFYVYEHWRSDTDVCFWVGKGHGRRAYRFKRNPHYNKIIKKLARLGMCVEVRLVANGLDEPTSFSIERERIAFWRSAGVALANYTDGGEGSSGRLHSEETRLRFSETRKGRKLSPEHRANISAGLLRNNGFKGKAHSEATRAKIAENNRLRGTFPSFKGHSHSEEAKARIKAALTGITRSPETRAKISATKRAANADQ